MSDPGNPLAGFFVVAFVFAIYFLPAIAAYLARRRQRAAILLLNLFLGWTVLGWIVAIIWAAVEDRPEKA